MTGHAVRLATWNLQGSAGLDVPAVAERLRDLADGPLDIVLLQEVQGRQTRALARALGLRAIYWGFKHWPVVKGAEGMAVLSRWPFVSTRTLTMQPAPFWSWKRRITLFATLRTGSGDVTVANVHLSPHDAGDLRVEQVGLLRRGLDAFAPGQPAVIAGDANDLPAGPAHQLLVQAGWRDAWEVRHDDAPARGGNTNWSPGPDRHGRPPDQRIDFVFAPPGWTVDRVVVGAPDGAGSFDQWAALSDHLPVYVTLQR